MWTVALHLQIFSDCSRSRHVVNETDILIVRHQLDMSQPGHCIVKTASTALDVKIRDPQSVRINFLHLFRDLHFREDVGQLV